MKISEKIYTLRKEHNLSQEELANKLNVSRQTVSKWELGESCPDFDKIIPLCEIFGLSTEELLRDKKLERNNDGQPKVDVVKALLICISIFMYFIAIISTIVCEEVLHLNDGITVSLFLGILAFATILLIFTLLTRRSEKPKDEKEVEFKKVHDPMMKSMLSIVSLITTCIYLLVSFLTMAWHITWIIWIVYLVVCEIIKLVYLLKKGEVYEEK